MVAAHPYFVVDVSPGNGWGFQVTQWDGTRERFLQVSPNESFRWLARSDGDRRAEWLEWKATRKDLDWKARVDEVASQPYPVHAFLGAVFEFEGSEYKVVRADREHGFHGRSVYTCVSETATIKSVVLFAATVDYCLMRGKQQGKVLGLSPDNRGELWGMVHWWPRAEWGDRWAVFYDYLQEGGWGSEWAETGRRLSVHRLSKIGDA